VWAVRPRRVVIQFLKILNEFITSSKSKFLDGFDNLIKSYNDYIPHLNTEQLCNLMTITCSSLIYRGALVSFIFLFFILVTI
jgi:hypothetical protein